MNDDERFIELTKKSHIITSDDILGKDVIDISGKYVGVATQMHIDKKEKRLIGLSIDTGFMKPFVFVGVDLIKTFGIDALYIMKTPSSSYPGMKVFDCNGVRLGKVHSVTFDENDSLDTVTVRYDFVRKLTIPTEAIQTIRHNIILGVDQETFRKLRNRK